MMLGNAREGLNAPDTFVEILVRPSCEKAGEVAQYIPVLTVGILVLSAVIVLGGLVFVFGMIWRTAPPPKYEL
jgi:hypothetical protein